MVWFRRGAVVFFVLHCATVLLAARLKEHEKYDLNSESLSEVGIGKNNVKLMLLSCLALLNSGTAFSVERMVPLTTFLTNKKMQLNACSVMPELFAGEYAPGTIGKKVVVPPRYLIPQATVDTSFPGMKTSVGKTQTETSSTGELCVALDPVQCFLGYYKHYCALALPAPLESLGLLGPHASDLKTATNNMNEDVAATAKQSISDLLGCIRRSDYDMMIHELWYYDAIDAIKDTINLFGFKTPDGMTDDQLTEWFAPIFEAWAEEGVFLTGKFLEDKS